MQSKLGRVRFFPAPCCASSPAPRLALASAIAYSSTLDDAAASEMIDNLNKGRRFERINFLSSGSPEADEARARLVGRYGDVHSSEADVIVALGGDGLMLQTLHKFMDRQADLRHEPRLGRLPDERISARTACANGWRRREARSSIRWRMIATMPTARTTTPMRSMRSRCCARPQAAKLRMCIDGRCGWRN